MGDGRRGWWVRWLGGLLLLALVLPVRGAGGAYEDRRAAGAGIQRALDGQADAVLAGDRDGYLAAVDPAARGYRAAQRAVFRNLSVLPLAQWSYRVEDLRLRGARAEADVRLRYRLRDYDRVPVTAVEKLDFARRDGRWYVAAERAGSARQLWEQGRVSVLRGKHSLVLSVDGRPGADGSMLRAVSAAADRAVPAVSLSWPRPWPRRLVVEVPATSKALAELLGAPGASYEGIAAVTTGTGGGTSAPSARVLVNPEAYGVLSGEGRQVVMTHETVHVASRPYTTDVTPLWLSEGLADWVGYRGTGRPPSDAAPQLARAVREDALPEGLPGDDEFRFDAAADALSRAYEGGWLACRMIADRWGDARLMAFYLEVGARRGGGGDEGRERAVDAALRDVLGLERAEFVALWRAYLREELA
ncbi:hypothetical protein [Streptomyces sp. Z26]|uniref:hypothetical protein n=1 Tax=Streptomyces sp. Z26 TaxID=2500177 RepID=UPI001F0BA56D|nr:hypothetical protein [Streptomyces sp. Z26]